MARCVAVSCGGRRYAEGKELLMFGKSLRLAFLSLALILAGIPPAYAQAPNVPPQSEDIRCWFVPASCDPGPRISIRASLNEAAAPGDPLTVVCTVSSKKTINTAWLRIEVTGPDGALLQREELTVSLGPQPQDYTFAVKPGTILDSEAKRREAFAGVRPASDDESKNVQAAATVPTEMPVGDSTVRFAVVRSPNIEEAGREYTLRRVSVSQMRAELPKLAAEIESLAARVQEIESSGTPVPYLRLRVDIASDSVRRARHAVDENDWRQVDTQRRYLARACEALKAQIAFAAKTPEMNTPVALPDLDSVEVRDGSFYAGDRPVFLLGCAYGEQRPNEELDLLHRYGLNFAVLSVGLKHTLPDATTNADIGAILDPVLARAKAANLTVAVSLDPNALCDWALAQWPFLADNGLGVTDITPNEARSLVERHLRAIAPYLAAQDRVSAINLIDRPRFKFAGETVRQGFLEVVRSQYNDRHEVNRAWRGLFADLDEIATGWDYENPEFKNTVRYMDTPAFQYDWRTYHRHLATQYIEGMASTVRSLAPGKPLSAALSDQILLPGETKTGPDAEALAATLDISGCCAANTVFDPFYAVGYPQQPIVYTFLRSLAPGKPVVNFEDGLMSTTDPDAPALFGYIHSAIWEAAMCGLNASALKLDDWLAHPECIEAYATACLDLNRLADIVVAFQRATADIAIFCSTASTIYGDGMPHLQSVRFAYEGCSFAGHKIRFISEKQCVETQLKDIKVLVIPETPAVSNAAFSVLRDYTVAENVVARIASSILYDEHGQSRRDIISPTRRTVLVHGKNLPTEYLHAMDAVIGFGELPSIPRTVNVSGYPIEGVRSQYVEVDGQGYLYVLNLRKSAVMCSVFGDRKTGRDLIRGRDIEFPMWLEPLDPMLIRLNPAAPVEPPAKERYTPPRSKR